MYEWLSCAVHFHFTGPGAAAHAQVLQRAAEAGALVALEVVQRNDDIGVHNGPADFGGLAENAAGDRDLHIVGALEAVGDQDLAAGGVGAEAVAQRGVQVVQGVFPGAHIERVAVGQEGIAAQLLDVVGHVAGKVGPEKGQIAQLAEMDLDGHIFALKIDLVHARSLHQLAELGLVVLSFLHTEVGEIYLRLLHRESLLDCIAYTILSPAPAVKGGLDGPAVVGYTSDSGSAAQILYQGGRYVPL